MLSCDPLEAVCSFRPWIRPKPGGHVSFSPRCASKQQQRAPSAHCQHACCACGRLCTGAAADTSRNCMRASPADQLTPCVPSFALHQRLIPPPSCNAVAQFIGGSIYTQLEHCRNIHTLLRSSIRHPHAVLQVCPYISSHDTRPAFTQQAERVSVDVCRPLLLGGPMQQQPVDGPCALALPQASPQLQPSAESPQRRRRQPFMKMLSSTRLPSRQQGRTQSTPLGRRLSMHIMPPATPQRLLLRSLWACPPRRPSTCCWPEAPSIC